MNSIKLKNSIYDIVLSTFKREVSDLSVEVSSVRDRAINSEGRNESRYDTHKSELSYLANSQSARLKDKNETLEKLSRLKLRKNKKVSIGSLVDIKNNNFINSYFFLPISKLLKVSFNSKDYFVVGLEAPFSEKAKDKLKGDTFNFRENSYEVLDVK